MFRRIRWLATLAALGLLTPNLSAGQTCDADLNNDGNVNVFDLALLAGCVPPAPGDCTYDVDGNGTVNMCDFIALQCQAAGGGDECCDCGMCCLTPTVCANTTATLCASSGGVFYGAGTICPEANAGVFNEPDNAGGNTFIHPVGPDVECPGDGKARNKRLDCTGTDPRDPWVTEGAGGLGCHSFNTSLSPPIPADFFYPGSEPFAGTVCLTGSPLGYGDWPDADTIILRSGGPLDGDPFDRCELPTGGPQVVTAEIVALSLVGYSPITVTGLGGDTQWDVAVDLSTVQPPQGQIVAQKTHCNGGTYSSTLHVWPRFTFTRVEEPHDVVVLDTGEAGRFWITLSPSSSLEWAFDVDPGQAIGANFCTDFHPGYETPQDIRRTEDQCDCNDNGIRDICDIESGFSKDCNNNTYPDVCDISAGRSTDTNLNGEPDECEGVTSVLSTPVKALLTLDAARPTPTRSHTTLSYSIDVLSVVVLTVHDVRGRLVAVVENQLRPPGQYAAEWNGQDESGTLVAPGVYYAKLQAGDETRSTRVVVRR